MRISKEQAAAMLLTMDDILILAHENPDGDAVGSACALCRALRSIGKNAWIHLESISRTDAFMAEGLTASDDFAPRHLVAVDTADAKILGVGGTDYDKQCKIELNIDHHISNAFFAENTCLDTDAAAAAEAVFDVLKLMKIPLTRDIAECLYVGIATDTGCFRFANTTAKTLRTAADLADAGIDLANINRLQFETKSKEYAAFEKMAIASMRTYFDGKCAMIVATNEMFVQSGVTDGETQVLSSVPRQIEGVYVGITMKEKKKGFFRISVRTNEPADAAAIAQHLGGGGHKMAAGCSFEGSQEDAVRTILRYTEEELKKIGVL